MGDFAEAVQLGGENHNLVIKKGTGQRGSVLKQTD